MSTFLQSPLRYPGGKSRAVAQILAHIPADVEGVCSPFLGGGSVELALAQKGIKVQAYDACYPLVMFWLYLLQSPKILAERIKKYYPMNAFTFSALQREKGLWYLEQGAAFYALNRSAFSGVVQGGMSPDAPHFTIKNIEALANFSCPNLQVEWATFNKSIPAHPNAFIYADPPYIGCKGLYGEKGDYYLNEYFNHEALAELLKARGRWLLSYNDCPEVRTLYKDHKMIPLQWKYGMTQNKQSNEILIFSKDLK